MAPSPPAGMISVVIPVHRADRRPERIWAAVPPGERTEKIIVLNGEAAELGMPVSDDVRVVVSERRGRGHALVRGAEEAGGDIVLFLHSDTILPQGWDREIRGILEDDRVVGGGFSLSFDSPDVKMRALAMLSDLWLRMTGHVWGDRAMFVRAETLRDAIGAMDVPIFEDVRLSQQMRGKGMVVISPLKVITSGEAFRRNGVLSQLWAIVKCHYWYVIGWDPERIFERYYR